MSASRSYARHLLSFSEIHSNLECIVHSGAPGTPCINEIYLPSFQELEDVLQNVPELAEAVGTECANQVLYISSQDGEEKVKEVLQSMFTELMSASKDVISKALSKLKTRLNMASEVD